MIDALHEHIRRVYRPQGEVPTLLLAALYKKAVDPTYDFAQENVSYKNFLNSKGVQTKRSFGDYFNDVMTGKDPYLGALKLGNDAGTMLHEREAILNEDGSFVDENVRSRMAAEGRKFGILVPKLVAVG